MYTHALLLLCMLAVIKESKQRGPRGRQVMQSTEEKERTRDRQEGREERKEELLLLGIWLSRNVLTVMSCTVGGETDVFWETRRLRHLFWSAAD